jgi:hypothetical protein
MDMPAVTAKAAKVEARMLAVGWLVGDFLDVDL